MRSLLGAEFVLRLAVCAGDALAVERKIGPKADNGASRLSIARREQFASGFAIFVTPIAGNTGHSNFVHTIVLLRKMIQTIRSYDYTS